jgi:5'-phosphate synthase pdxT subunit
VPSQPQQSANPLTIGILALQGAYEAHARTLDSLGVSTRLLRTPGELHHPDGSASIDGLIIPGGESTTMLKFLERNHFLETLKTFVRQTPTFGTCAGAILLATDVQHPAQTSLAALDITIERNAYGRQIDSSILTVPTSLPGGPLEMVFIRAPRITRTGPQVETLASRDGFPVLVRQDHLLAATFHPELSTDTRVHQLFLDLIREADRRNNLETATHAPAQPHS